MKALHEEFDLILVSQPAHEVDVAASMLEAAGIPTYAVRRGLEGGYVPQPAVHADLFVPRGAGRRALALLAQRGNVDSLSEIDLGQREADRGAWRPWLRKSQLPLFLLVIFGVLAVLLLLRALL